LKYRYSVLSHITNTVSGRTSIILLAVRALIVTRLVVTPVNDSVYFNGTKHRWFYRCGVSAQMRYCTAIWHFLPEPLLLMHSYRYTRRKDRFLNRYFGMSCLQLNLWYNNCSGQTSW